MDTMLLDKAGEMLSLIKQYFTEEDASDEHWLTDFAHWLTASQEKENEDIHDVDEFTDVLIGMQLINTSNMLKTKLNKFVAESPFASFLDYQFLYILREHTRMTKSELIFAHNMEMSSGIEVIKRLLKHDWIWERPNPDDGRSKLIMVTEEGERLLSRYGDSARDIYTSFSRDMPKENKKQILQALYLVNPPHLEG